MPALLDTGVLELLRRRDRRVEALVLKHYPPVLCPHVAGEFIHGQLQAGVSQAAILKARTYVAAFESLVPTNRTADHYAELRTRLLSRGIQLPEPYCWIAAYAREHGFPLVTTDRLFRQLPEITVRLIHSRPRAASGRAATPLALFVLYLVQDLLADAFAALEGLGTVAGMLG